MECLTSDKIGDEVWVGCYEETKIGDEIVPGGAATVPDEEILPGAPDVSIAAMTLVAEPDASVTAEEDTNAAASSGEVVWWQLAYRNVTVSMHGGNSGEGTAAKVTDWHGLGMWIVRIGGTHKSMVKVFGHCSVTLRDL